MPIVARAVRGPKSEDIVRQENLANIAARKARIAAATAKLVETPISAQSKKVRKVAVPAAIEQVLVGTTTAENSETAVPAAIEQELAGTTTAENSENAVPAASQQDLEGARTVPTVLAPISIFPLPILHPQINVKPENIQTAKKGTLKRAPTPHPSKGMFPECKAWKPCANPPDTLGRTHNAAHEQVRKDHAQYNRGIKRSNPGSKVTSADWIFDRIPIERSDMFLPVPTATGTKVKMGTPLVKEVREFGEWMRSTMFVDMGGKVY